MIILRGTVRQRIKGLGKELKPIQKRTMLDVGEFWHREILLRRHFSSIAHGEYRHKDRTFGWKADKKQIGHGEGRFLDNVMFGRTRRYAAQGPRFTATASKGRVRFEVPAYIKNPGHDAPEQHPKPAEELTAHTDRDRDAMLKFYDERIEFYVRDARLRAAFYTTQF